MLISKSNFQIFRKCPDAFWMLKHAKDKLKQKPLSDFEKQIIDQGHEVESWARKLFSNGVLVEGYNEVAMTQTRTFLENGEKEIFQAAFSADGLLAMCDIIKWNEDLKGWDIYEVKGTTSKDKPKMDHYWDIAFQREVLERSNEKVARLYLLELNKEFIKDGEVSAQELLNLTDITEEIDTMRVEIQSEIGSCKLKLKQTHQPSGCECRYKTRKHQCEAFEFFYPNVPDYTVYDISRIRSGGKKIVEMVDNDIIAIEDIPDQNDLTEIQANQVQVHNYDSIICKTEQIKSELQKLEYPLYFLDYETYPSAVPVFDCCHPFQQVPFQYSLHIQQTPESDLEHFEFLHSQNSNPIPSLAKQLRENIGKTGSVIVWNKKFEGMCNSDMSKQVPELADFLNGINQRFFDLEEPFKRQLYVRKEFRGKTSIKNVLPVLAPELSYKELNIQDGGSACNAWKKMIFHTEDLNQKKGIYADLLAYCKLDTLAMVKILEFLKSIYK